MHAVSADHGAEMDPSVSETLMDALLHVLSVKEMEGTRRLGRDL